MAEKLGIVVDLDKCIGCYACVVACKQENYLPPHGDGVPFVAGPQWMKVYTIGPLGTYPNLSMYYIPRICMHCEKAPCIDSCPANAIYRRDDGIVLINESVCLQSNCSEQCIPSCPYSAIYPKDEKGVAGKCNLCVQRIDKGLEPACVMACPTDALSFGDIATLEIKKPPYEIPLPQDQAPEPLVKYMKSR